MKFSLIICTYNRPEAILNLLNSIKKQSLYPDEILIIDSSENKETEGVINNIDLSDLKYYRVNESNRGLTKQRNYGIKKVYSNTEIVCFLDDDIILEDAYFMELISTYIKKPDTIAVGGWIIDETQWEKAEDNYKPAFNEFLIDGYVRKLGQRNVLRKRLGLLSDRPPGYMPKFSHGFSTGFLPPSGKTYEVEFFMGGVSSYRKCLFNKIEFSSYFEGYGLYEDMDFCLRASKLGKLYVNTSARVLHLHETLGRPDYYKYGQMVVKNGKYVWKIKNPKPEFSAKIKWYEISYLLAFIRLFNYLNGDETGFRDFKGRISELLK